MKYPQLFKLLLAGSILLPGVVFAQATQLQATASASSQSGSSRSAAMAADNNTVTRWEASNSSAGSWLALSFPKPVTLQSLSITEHGDRILASEIEINSGQGWLSVLALATVPKSAFSLPASQVTGVRIRTTARAAGQPSIVEFRAFGALGPEACIPGGTIDGDVDCGGKTVGVPCGTLAVPLFVLKPNARISNFNVAPNASGSGIQCEGNCIVNNGNWRGACGPAVAMSANALPGTRMLVMNGSYHSADVARTPFALHPDAVNLGIEVRYMRFTGLLSGITPRAPLTGSNAWRNNRFTLINTSLQSSIVQGSPSPNGLPQRAVVSPNIARGDVASIYGLRIIGYQPGTPPVCNAWVNSGDTLFLLGEQWDTTACNVSPTDVSVFVPLP